jgi:hypothetical protein
MSPYRNWILCSVIASVLFLPIVPVFAQSNTAERAQLEAELVKIEQEIKAKEAELQNQKKQTGGIKRDLGVIQKEIEAKKLEIQKKNTLLQRLGGQIKEKDSVIQSLSDELTREKQSLARLLRKQKQLETYSLAEILLQGATFSEFFQDIYTFSDLKSGLTNSFQKIKTIQALTAEQKAQLLEKKDEENKVKVTLEKDKKVVEVKKKETDVLLKVSTNKEKEYAEIIKERKAKAAQIRTRLFSLIEVKGGGIPFGEAVRLAKAAGELTGVRPAFILGILQQETGIGRNVGQCYMTDPATGDGVRISSGASVKRVMPAGLKGQNRNDAKVFLDITGRLGKDYAKTAISCPLPGVGYGGAMGPSQFIPSTWEGMESRLEKKLGVDAANPWIPLHAFTATALYVADLGATGQTYDSERNAACRYYSGRKCDTPGVRNAFYGNSVMKHADGFQDDIELLDEDR